MRKWLLSFLAVGFLFQSVLFGSTDVAKEKYLEEVSSPAYLQEIIRHLYRWYFDEADIEKRPDSTKVVFQIRLLSPKLDKGDKSQYAEIYIPLWNVSVKIKKSDYMIEETNKEIKSNGFKIINVSRIPNEALKSSDFVSTELDAQEMKEYLFVTRRNAEFPDEELLKKIRTAFEQQFISLKKHELADTAHDDQQDIIHIAPLSPVGNDIWAYWESGKMIIHCTSDIDITNPEVWALGDSTFHCYDAYNNTVLSLAEAEGSNELFTRNQVGRVLYNCMLLGRRVSLTQEKYLK